MPDGEKLAAVREALPAVGAGLYLDVATAGPLPAEVVAAMAEITDWELRVGRSGRDRVEDVAGRLDEARAAVAATLAVDLDAVRLTTGIEDALARAIGTLEWQAGDRLVALDDPALDAVARLAPPGVEALRVGDVDELETAVDGRTRLVVAPLVSAAGRRLPLDRTRGRLAATGGRLLVDASLAVGAIPLPADALETDLTVARCDAWLLGPQGLGVVVAPAALRARVAEPAGTSFHLPSVVGLARACGWLSMYVGLPWALARIEELMARAVDSISRIDGLDLLTPGAADERAAVLAVRIAGWTPDAALDELGRRTFLVASRVPGTDALRASIGWWNTAEEIDRFVAGLALLAEHGPDTLPRRRQLAILGQEP
jgi:L-cysteine/cystine lyase